MDEDEVEQTELVIVEVSGGVVQEVTSPEYVEVVVIDYDNVESGRMPKCCDLPSPIERYDHVLNNHPDAMS